MITNQNVLPVTIMLSGDYCIVNKKGRISIDTLTSPPADFITEEAFTIGSHKTENLGVERIVINLVAHPHVRAIIICGKESFGHYAGQALISLWENGIDDDGKIIGAKGPIPYLENINKEVVDRFREQILHIEDMIDNTDPEAVRGKAREIIEKGLPEFDKAPMDAESMGKKKKTRIPQACGESLTFSEEIRINPVTLKISI